MNNISYIPSFTSPSILNNSIISNNNSIDWWRCHRGLPIYVRMENNEIALSCICPPSYYGDRCQYENQRVSLTIQIRSILPWHTMVTFLITLIDNQRNIESYDYIDYLYVRDCDTKFNIYLLYSKRPKDLLKNYSVQIDMFNKMTLQYYTSWIYPIQFSFLPVYRLAVLLKIPMDNSVPNRECRLSCIHGQCFSYINKPNSTFCRCNHDWSGEQCNIEKTCKCAIGSLCIDGSICICPLDRFGPHCYLHRSQCTPKSCANNGQCIPHDERYLSAYSDGPVCVCSDQYFGSHCEYEQGQIDIRFHNSLSVPQVLFIHLISVQDRSKHLRTSLMKRIGFDQNSVLFTTSIIFNIVFAEMFQKYYLIIIRQENIISAKISTEILPSYRCLSISEIFNETIAKRHLLKRIKLYHHIPCKERLDLVCFYDEIHLCLCDLSRQANCFEFNHSLTYDCQTYNLCENKGKCFKDHVKCSTSFVCACEECYYGSKCQFSTRGTSLSLDIILGYGIRPNTSITHQSLVVKVAIIITMMIFCLGLLNSILSLITFKSKKSRDVGCGFYLLTSSITSLITIIVLTIKLWVLLLIQINIINNFLFIQIQCISIDFILRVLVSSVDWLSACVGIERGMMVSKGINFNKQKSQKISKWIILIVFILTISTHIHDPIHRQWINDDGEKRSWCITEYSSTFQIIEQILNLIHFSIPFGINCISAFIVIIIAAHSRSTVQKKQSYRQHFYEQFNQHKHLLISSLILVLLALPRLIISFIFQCMKSARNPWLYMIGYFISFIPSILTFVIFVLPSKTYKNQFFSNLGKTK